MVSTRIVAKQDPGHGALLILEAYVVCAQAPAHVLGIKAITHGQNTPYKRVIDPR
jgi:hypothetical protein